VSLPSLDGTPSAGRAAPPRLSLAALAALPLLVVALALAARASEAAFLGVGAAIVAALAYLAFAHPRPMLVAAVFLPIVDRYLVGLLVPSDRQPVTNYLSESLLVLVALSIGLRAWRDGRLGPALRHPTLWLVGAFVALGAVSAVANGVPPLVAVAGIGFTVEAVALFALPRMIGFDQGWARLAFGAFTGMALLLAVLALCQVVLHADFLGLQSFTGRFEEGRRVAAFLVNPNMLGAVLAMGVPLPLLFTIRAHGTRGRLGWGLLSLVLVLALLYTFSRGAWLGLGVAILAVGVMVDWRAPVALLLCCLLAYGTALVLPRHVLDPDPGDVGFDLGAATLGRFGALSGGTDLRLRFVQNATPIIADHTLLGAGPGRYGGAVAWRFGTPLSEEYTAGAVPRDRTVDNFWLHLVVEFGLLGVTLFAAALAAATWQLLRTARRAGGELRVLLASAAAMAVVVAVDSLTEMLLEGNTTSLATWFFLGLGSVLAGAAAAAAVAEPSRRLVR
jgi:O-antigen ligase